MRRLGNDSEAALVTDQQVRKLMRELGKGVPIGIAAAKAGMDRKTARKYRDAGKMPSQMRPERTWRTRPEPFAEDWADIELMLDDAPELEAKTLFDYLRETLRPGRYRPGQLRTFQRRVSDWRALHGPEREVFFPQRHEPGALSQTDFTWLTSLEMTIAGAPAQLLFCHVVLTYSNWEWGTLCRSESLAALRRGVQAAFFRLGKVTREHQTDNSTAATHTLGSGKRKFNDDYAALMRHLGMKPRTTGVGKKEQNGYVEAANGAFKRRVEQHLLLRGHRDFESVEALEKWLQGGHLSGLAMVTWGKARRRGVDVRRLCQSRSEEEPGLTLTVLRIAQAAVALGQIHAQMPAGSLSVQPPAGRTLYRLTSPTSAWGDLLLKTAG